jgi:hypothetical protein
LMIVCLSFSFSKTVSIRISKSSWILLMVDESRLSTYVGARNVFFDLSSIYLRLLYKIEFLISE